MDITLQPEIILSENRFWLQIMGDHARFIFFSLAPTEAEYIMIAQQFILKYDELLAAAQNPLPITEMENLLDQAYHTTYQFKEFKQELLAMSLTADLNSHLSPSFYNDMLNELEEFLNVLSLLRSGKFTLQHPLHYHLLWLPDAVGHAATIAAELDFIEKDLIDLANRFELQFEDLSSKALFMNGYLRAAVDSFPALNRLNEQAATVIQSFTEFLDNLRDQRADHKILGTLMPLMADHMSREECYYLWKLFQSTGAIRKPNCDPGRPRMKL